MEFRDNGSVLWLRFGMPFNVALWMVIMVTAYLHDSFSDKTHNMSKSINVKMHQNLRGRRLCSRPIWDCLQRSSEP